MANPEAVNRMAQAKPMGGMGGGMPEDMEGPEPANEGPKEGGLDTMVESLKGVGAFLHSQGPGAQEAMGHFQALLQSMSKLGGAAPGAPQGAPAGAPPPQEPKGNGRMRMDQLPGTQVL